jgi:hypothetical protein
MAEVERKSKMIRQFGHEPGIAAPFLAASSMIEMGDRQSKLEFRRASLQGPEQAHAIPATRDSDHDARTSEPGQVGVEGGKVHGRIST